MKTIDEWNLFWMSASGPNTLKELIKAIQSDAFHAGEMKGLEDAKAIVSGNHPRHDELLRHWGIEPKP